MGFNDLPFWQQVVVALLAHTTDSSVLPHLMARACAAALRQQPQQLLMGFV